jgi:hypothetical protein
VSPCSIYDTSISHAYVVPISEVRAPAALLLLTLLTKGNEISVPDDAVQWSNVRIIFVKMDHLFNLFCAHTHAHKHARAHTQLSYLTNLFFNFIEGEDAKCYFVNHMNPATKTVTG